MKFVNILYFVRHMQLVVKMFNNSEKRNDRFETVETLIIVYFSHNSSDTLVVVICYRSE